MIVGEVRNREATEALFDVLLAGQARGSYATFHAQSVDEALSRLRSFGIAENDLGSMDCIIVQRRMLLYDPKKRSNSEVRRIVEIAEMGCGKAKTLYKDGKLAELAGKSALVGHAAEAFDISMKEMAAELKRRARLITKTKPDYREFYKAVQKDLYGFEDGEE